MKCMFQYRQALARLLALVTAHWSLGSTKTGTQNCNCLRSFSIFFNQMNWHFIWLIISRAHEFDTYESLPLITVVCQNPTGSADSFTKR